MFKLFRGRLFLIRLILLVAVLLLVAIGIATIYSLGHPAEPGPADETAKLSGFWKKQIVYAAGGMLAFIAVNLVNYRKFGRFSYGFYGLILLLLGVLLLDRVIDLPFVPVINGTRRWIRFQFGGHSLPAIQPSEICKLSYILALAWYLRYQSNYSNFRVLIGPFVLTILPMVMILLEPDLGTVLLMMPVLFTMLFVAGAKIKHLLIIIFMAAIVSPLLWYEMNQYQRVRISSVLLQNRRVQEIAEKHLFVGEFLVGKRFTTKQWKNEWGYHLIRSKYAVASGGGRGYGFGRGPFTKYNFLPERHNDFIFAAISHQWGFRGCLILFGLYILLIACGVDIATHARDPFGRLLAVGITAMFAVEVLVNVSMTLGLMPITGLTLPFVSYGGSSLLVSLVSVGLLNNIGRRRPFSVAPIAFG